MAIQIVRSKERITYKDEDSKVYYRRISTLKRAAIVKHRTKRGKPDWTAITADILNYVIVGWETVQDEGVDIAFDAELITALPEDTLTDILELSGGANPGMEDKEPEN
jgi:hypothetical protein